ncbi:hypothetical protein SEVIR_7G252901v4 [Setaria viridis]
MVFRLVLNLLLISTYSEQHFTHWGGTREQNGLSCNIIQHILTSAAKVYDEIVRAICLMALFLQKCQISPCQKARIQNSMSGQPGSRGNLNCTVLIIHIITNTF